MRRAERDVLRHEHRDALPQHGIVVATHCRLHEGIHMGVISARFVKPLDLATILKAIGDQPLVVTVEEGTLLGGFGSAVLEAANAAGLDTRHVLRRGYPDKFIEHGDRIELLADLGLNAAGLAECVKKFREETADELAPAGVR